MEAFSCLISCLPCTIPLHVFPNHSKCFINYWMLANVINLFPSLIYRSEKQWCGINLEKWLKIPWLALFSQLKAKQFSRKMAWMVSSSVFTLVDWFSWLAWSIPRYIRSCLQCVHTVKACAHRDDYRMQLLLMLIVKHDLVLLKNKMV